MVDQSSSNLMSRQKSGRRRSLLLGGRGGNDQKKGGPSRRGSLFGALSRRVRRSSQTFTRTETTVEASVVIESNRLPEEDLTTTARESSLESLTEVLQQQTPKQEHHQNNDKRHNPKDPRPNEHNSAARAAPSSGDAAPSTDEDADADEEEEDEPFDAWLNNVLHDGHHVAAMCDTVDPDPEMISPSPDSTAPNQSSSLVQEFEKNRIRSFSKKEPLELDFSIIEESLARPDSMEFTPQQNAPLPVTTSRKGARQELLTRATSSKRKNAKLEKYLSRDGSRRAVIAPAAATTTVNTTSSTLQQRHDGHHGKRGSVVQKAALQRDVTA